MYLDNSYAAVKRFDAEMARLVEAEEERQRTTLNLIVSENYASPLAIGLEGSVLANKNAQGYPDTRMVGGCEIVNEVERIAVQRIKTLFGCEHANLQSMSATLANIAVLRALLKDGDTILALGTALGGHISHGDSCNLSGTYYHVVHYGFDPKTEQIDMNEVEDLAKSCRPMLIICGSGAYPRLVDYEGFSRIAKSVGAYLLADIAHPAGLIAAGLIPSPVPFADVVTSTTHKTWRGSRGCGVILCTQELAKRIDREVSPGLQGAPKMDMIAARAVQAKESMTPQFKAYQRQTMLNAAAFADELQKCGLRLISGGTDTHLILADIRSHIASGALANDVLSSVGMVINKEPIPFDPQGDGPTSGIRIGTPALTTRGLKEREFRQIAHLLSDALRFSQQPDKLAEIREEAARMAVNYPLFSAEWMPV